MKEKSDIERLEKLIGQLQGLHAELTSLAKKSPNDAVNSFKLRLINRVIENGKRRSGQRISPIRRLCSV
jgi:hypothetical protein